VSVLYGSSPLWIVSDPRDKLRPAYDFFNEPKMDKIGDALANGRPWEAIDIQRNAGQYDPFFNSSVRDMLEADRSVKIDDALQNGKPWIAVDHMGSVGKYDALFDATAQIARYTPFISPAVGGVEIWGILFIRPSKVRA
jgi:hypothetical protein